MANASFSLGAQCNRRYPCNHCIRRRQPEGCIYNSTPAVQARQTEKRTREDVPTDHEAESQGASGNSEHVGTSANWATKANPTPGQRSHSSVGELFGYVQYSKINTMALVRRLGLDEDESWVGNRDFPSEAYNEIEKNIRRLPDREIFDVLVQYYITEVHWLEQVVYTPWFLVQYQQWWTLERRWTVFEVEFAVLFLRICSYTSQFLPSPSYTVDRIRGMPLDDIRNICDDVAQKLAATCAQVDARGALIRVQHLSVSGLQRQGEGRIDAFWEALSNAVQVAQRIGLHRGRVAWTHGMEDFDKEIRCRVFCNLYIWDKYGASSELLQLHLSNKTHRSLLSRQLDCPPLLPASLTSEHLPYMSLSSNLSDSNAPEGFSDRAMQARLASFWRSFPEGQGAEYEPTVAEERYEKFCADYLTQVPPAFALEPNKEWDERLRRLSLQRQIFHVGLFESLCYHFRPVLLLESSWLQKLPAYKKMLVASQKRALAAAALKVLDGVSKLHDMLGGSHTRLPTIIMPTFEAAVVLVSLTMDEHFPDTTLCEYEPPFTPNVDPLGNERACLTRDRCKQAMQEALGRLILLADISNMAQAGAKTLARLIAKVTSNDVVQWPSVESYNSIGLDKFFAQYSKETFSGSTI